MLIKINNRYHLKIIQAYAPTTSSDDAEAEIFYDNISEALQYNQHTIQYCWEILMQKWGRSEINPKNQWVTIVTANETKEGTCW